MGVFLGFLFLGPRGALRKDFFCFFFLGAFFCCCWGACSSFLLLFSVPALSGSCFSSFFEVFCSFFALGAGRRAVLFSPSSFGLVFVCFSLFLGFFRRFFFSKGFVLVVGPFLGLFWDPGGL